MFKKKPEDLNVKQALIYLGLVTGITFAPLLIILNWEDIKEWCKDKIAKIPHPFRKED